MANRVATPTVRATYVSAGRSASRTTSRSGSIVPSTAPLPERTFTIGTYGATTTAPATSSPSLQRSTRPYTAKSAGASTEREPRSSMLLDSRRPTSRASTASTQRLCLGDSGLRASRCGPSEQHPECSSTRTPSYGSTRPGCARTGSGKSSASVARSSSAYSATTVASRTRWAGRPATRRLARVVS